MTRDPSLVDTLGDFTADSRIVISPRWRRWSRDQRVRGAHVGAVSGCSRTSRTSTASYELRFAGGEHARLWAVGVPIVAG